MSKEQFNLVQGGDVLIAAPIQDVSAAATNGIYASMRHVKRLNILILLAAGTGGQSLSITLAQATTAAGASKKVLNLSSIYTKAGADLAAVNVWTEVVAVTRRFPVATLNSADSGVETLQKAYLLVVDEEDLDTNNGFSFIRVEMTDPGATARTGAILYIAAEKNYQGLSTLVL